VGGHVLDLLLADDEVWEVHALGRRSLGRAHAKLTEHLVDFEKLDVAGIRVDEVYACLGTTIKVAGSQERFRRVDHDYSAAVARLARDEGARRLALVSSVGASPTAASFYLKVKGETERDIEALGYETLAILRPSMLLGERTEKRTGEKIGIAVARALSFAMVGGLRGYKPIEARDVAAAMVVALREGETGSRVIEHDAIRSLSGALR
jgi:uncharacterized protein YbjT (DUF2867 family)